MVIDFDFFFELSLLRLLFEVVDETFSEDFDDLTSAFADLLLKFFFVFLGEFVLFESAGGISLFVF